ncbi:MAG: hypothetical protein OXE96_14570 [Gemmatimonadetes bacterium]|nr:hypothetical protein [Gemmatimonadota bacterium]
MPSPKPPIADLRIGTARAAIWANETDDDQTYHTVTFSRLYKTDDGEWRDTGSFRRGDLLSLAKLADQAHTKLLALQQKLAAAPAHEVDEDAA